MATPLKDARPPLTLVKNAPAAPAPLVVEKRPRAAWIMSRTELRQRIVYTWDNAVDWCIHHATHSPYYLGWSVRGYRRLCLFWWKGHHDGYRQQIKTAKLMLKQAEQLPRGEARAAAEAKARAILDVRRAEYRAHKKKYWIRTGISGFTAAVGVTVGVTAGAWWVQALMVIAAICTGAYFGRPDEPVVQPVQAPTRTSHLGEETMRRVLVEAGAVPEKRGEEIRGVGIPHTEGPGIAYAVHLPSGIPAAVAVAKKQQIAAAMAVHSDWLDLGVGSVETLLLVWVASEDPFGVVRPSPLLDHKGPTNTFLDGVPVAFGKRGNPIILHVRDTSLIVGGATRRGKGMLLANILIGAAKDPWVNIRIFDGKGAAEHNPYAPIMATFVKRNPERLAIASRIIKDEVDRRSDLLDDHGHEKIDDDNYEEVMKLLGGREVFICDELATYTPRGTSPWDDEITENLSQIAAVGAAVGVLLISLTQVPEVAVIRGRLRQNHVGRAAMNTESGTASNTILGDGMTGQGYDASKIPLDQPGRFWLATPETGVIQGRSYLVKPDDKRKVVAEAYSIRKVAGRLPGQWRDLIEEQLLDETGVSSVAGGQGGKGRIGSAPIALTLLDHLIDAAAATGRGEATRAEVFAHLATVDQRYGYRVDETDAQYNSRVGKLLAAAMAAEGLDIKAVKVSTAEGKESRGFRLGDLTAAQ
ncbi:FtsK/SpoIIIE domain-containing protein [Streptomyces luteocolor]|uniref:FtsK/SpoIIIE domain-containing protein n=1 Tax=Streptomyces luteocolor TaxID=285500 RepID=UPI0008532C89|nr:FtsK/SpoIIIE domain-containing protein [Streptomyces luteocolor]